jgi:hypothetical protein
VAAVRLGHRGERKDVGLEIAEVVIRDAGIGRIGEDREIGGAVGGQSVAHGAHEVVIRPGADAVFGIRGNVGTVEDTEGGLQGPATGQRWSLALDVGATTGAATGVKQVAGTSDRVLAGGPCRSCR